MIEPLTRAAFEAGEPCPGCGVPWQGTLVDLCLIEIEALEQIHAGPASGLAKVSDRHVDNLLAQGLIRRAEEQITITVRGRRATAALRRENARYSNQHGGCRAGRHRIANGPTHCMACCPPPPLSDQQIAKIAAILRQD